MQVLHEDGRTASRKSYMWLVCSGGDADTGPPIVIYNYRATRAGQNAVELTDGFKGHYLMCDGYQGYNKVRGVIRCACLAHVRRKFSDAIPRKDGKEVPGSPASAGRDYCSTLFMWERKFAGMAADRRKNARLEHEKPVLDGFRTWLDGQKPVAGSRLGKAVDYALNMWPFMQNYLLDGHLEISNQKAENHVRPFAVGRRNWLFSDSVNGAVASCAIYSLIETAKASRLHIKPYLEHVMKYMRDHANGSGRIDDILPWSEEMQERYSQSVKVQVTDSELRELEQDTLT